MLYDNEEIWNAAKALFIPLYARSASLLKTTLDKELNNSTILPFEEGVRGGKVIFPEKHMDFPLW